MTTFKINDSIHIECEYRKTKNGFCHRANLFENGYQKATAFCSYLNRTWERYDYESVLKKILRKWNGINQEQQEQLINEWANNPELNGMKQLGFIGAIASLGEIFADTQQEKNDWKKRMLKAGIGEGISFPDDWDTLSEEEKEKRLNGAIEIIK